MAGSQSDGVSLPTLILTGGPLDGTEFPLRMGSREVSIGSSGGSDVQVALGNVDPVHALLTFGEGGLTISDVGSATGTFLNGEKVEDEMPLQDGDRICLGPPGAKESAKLLVRLPGTGSAPASKGGAPGGPAFLDAEPGPVLIGPDDGPPISLAEEAPWPPPATPPPAPVAKPQRPAAPPPPPAPEAEEEAEILSAEDVVVDGSAVGPPLGADEVPPPDEPLFATPLPEAPSPPLPATPKPPPPPAPRPAAPTPPPPPPRAVETLTAPPPEEPPAPAEIPSLLDEPPRSVAPSPPRRTTAVAARGRRPARRGRKSSPPVMPIVGGGLVLLAVGAAAWWFLLRPAPAARPAPPPAPPPAAATAGVPPQGHGGRAPTAPPGQPEATRLEPDVALPGQTIEIRGQLPTGPVSVTIGGEKAEVGEATAEVIRIVVPRISLPSGQTVPVLATVGTKSLPQLDLVLGRLPLILKLTPAAGPVGERVVLAGRGFDPQPRGNAVTFGGSPALVLSASPTELTVVVPSPRTAGLPEVPVIVTARGRASASDRTFAMTRTGTSAYVPRFYAAPVTEYPGDDLAFVSTELGPVLLLGGPAGSASTGSRAADLAARLNALVARAPSRRVDIELRERPDAVAVVGEAGPLVSATAEDAAAYARGWERGGRRAPRMSPSALTRYWAALLQDYFGLFLYRERPLEVAALSPRGRVFLEIYAEATRRSGTSGVPASVVLPTSETMAEALRLVALVPAAGPAREEIAVEGRWQGTIDDPTTGARRFEVSFKPAGKGLDGAIKTWRGSLELGSPLRDISFRGGTLRFTTDLQGTPHRFEGILHDTTITGTATREGRPPAPFSLDLVE